MDLPLRDKACYLPLKIISSPPNLIAKGISLFCVIQTRFNIAICDYLCFKLGLVL